MGDFSTNPPKKKTRRPTSLKCFNARGPGYRYKVEFDSDGDPIGPFANKFRSYLGVVARTKVSILPMGWDQVDAETKKIVWDDILETFEVPEDEEFKKTWMAYIGLCWKQFKTTLTTTYVYGKGDNDGETTPCHKYSSISIETWDAFVRSRLTPEFVVKREAAKKSQGNNKYYHTMSRGGYKKLKRNLKKEKEKIIQEESSDPDLEVEPTSPERHELWKAARKNKSGAYITEESALVASKIDELMDMRHQGSFVPRGKNDILTAAIGTPEHPGRVRGAGRGVGLKKYFGGVARPGSSSSQVDPIQMMKQMEEKLMKNVEAMVKERINKVVAEQIAAMGSGGQNAVAEVPSPITNAESNGSCPPSHMEELVKHDWLRDLIVKGYDDQGITIILEHEEHHCFVSFTELTDIASGKKGLELCHLAIWCTYLCRLCAERGADNLYGFVCPFKINLKGYPPSTISAYIQDKMTGNKKIYLAPFCNSNHWQLIVMLPEQNTVVWMCSLSKRPTKKIKEMISKAMGGYSTSDTKWLYPTVARQEINYQCGYFVMKFMLTIVSVGIVDNWEKVFDNPNAYTHNEILEVCQLWAEFCLKFLGDQTATTP